MMLMFQIAAGVALAPFVFALAVTVLRGGRYILCGGLWYDHPEFTSTLSIAAICGLLVLVLRATS